MAAHPAMRRATRPTGPARRIASLLFFAFLITGLFSMTGARRVYAQATPGCAVGVCITSSTRLQDFDSGDSELLDALVGSMIGSDVDMSLLDWQGLATTEFTLEDLQTALGAGTPDAALTGPVTLEQLLTALNNIDGPDDLPAIDTLLDAVGDTPNSDTTIRLGDLLQVDSGVDQHTTTNLNALDVVLGSIELFSAQNLATTPEPVTISGAALGLDGIGDITVQSQVIQPPVIKCGPSGTTFYSAGVRVKLSVTVLDTTRQGSPAGLDAVDVALQISSFDIYLDVAPGSGIVQTINALTRAVTVQATPGVTDIYVGTLPDSVFFSSDPIDPASLTPGVVGSLTITLPTVPLFDPVIIQVPTIGLETYAKGKSEAKTLNFTGDPAGSGNYPQTLTAAISATAATSYTADLLTNLQVDVDLEATLDGLLGDVGGPILTPLLALLGLDDLPDLTDPVIDLVGDTLLPSALEPLFTTLLGDVVDPLLDGFGVGLGEMDVTVLGVLEQCPALVVTKFHTSNFSAGDTGVYTILVTNTGTYTAQFAVTLADVLPSGLSYASHTPASWVRQGTSTNFVSNVKVGPGQAMPPLLLTVNVATDAPGVVFNSASANTTGNTGGANSQDSDRTVITGSTDNDGDGTADDDDPDDNDPCVPDNTVAACDRDGDGLTNGEEEFYGTFPDNPDSDGDGPGLNDGEEVNRTPPSDPMNACDPNPDADACDLDGDGLDNSEEKAHNTFPDDPDSDNDGVNDGDEVNGDPPSDPLNACDPDPNADACDRDDDGLDNGGESNHHTDPDDPDSDSDTINDGDEVDNGSDPTDSCDPNPAAAACGAADSDGDNVPDDEDEDPNDPCVPNINAAKCDQDDDGLDNGEEGNHNTVPTNPDTDADGINDGTEVDNGSDPVNPCSPNDQADACDRDGDGLTNVQEGAAGTNPDNPDSDGDGIQDGTDVAPKDPCVPDASVAACPAGTGAFDFSSYAPTIKVRD